MLKNIIKNEKFIPWTVFIFFFCITLSIRSFSPYFSMRDDAYYHARESASMWMGEKTVMPAFSTLSDKPVDLYYLYHLTMAPFTYFFKGENYEALILGVKIYQSILTALLFLVFYLILRDILQEKISNRGERAIIWQSLFGTLLLFVVSSHFTIRMIQERPAILSIMAMLGIFYFIINKKWHWGFLTAMALPFFYSVSFLILIPGFIFLFTYFFNKTTPIKEIWKPIEIITVGLMVGILLRPDSWAYFYNGYLALILLIKEVLFFRIHALLFPNDLYVAPELKSGVNSYENWKGIFFIISLSVTYGYLILKEFKNKISVQDFFLFLLSFTLVVGSLIIVRLIEYALPFAILFCFSTQDVWMNYFTYLPSKVKKLKRIIYCSMVIFFFLLSIIQLNSVISVTSNPLSKNFNNYQNYKSASLYIKEHLKPESIVYLEGSLFPQLFFYNSKIFYSSGIDEIFQKIYDYPLYEKTVAFDNGEIPADFLKNKKVEYILVDERFISFSSTDSEKFKQNIKNDKNLILLYQDPDYPHILIYGFK